MTIQLEEINICIKSLKHKPGRWVVIKWVFYRGEIEALQPRMESVKPSLHALVNILAARKLDRTAEMRRKM